MIHPIFHPMFVYHNSLTCKFPVFFTCYMFEPIYVTCRCLESIIFITIMHCLVGQL